MSDLVVLLLTALLAVGVLGWAAYSIWHVARRTPTRRRALSAVLGGLAGTVLLGIVLPAALKGALDPFPFWLLFAVPTAVSAAVLGWRWPALAAGTGRHPTVVLASVLLLLALAMAGVAVT